MNDIDRFANQLRKAGASVTVNGATLSIGGYADLGSLTELSIPEGATLSIGGYADLRSLTELSIPEGATLSIGGNAYLGSLTELSIPEGATLSIGGYAYLRSLTELSIPEGATLGNGRIRVDSMQFWRGQRTETIDGITTFVGNHREVSDAVVVRRDCYATLDLNSPESTTVYVAFSGDLAAHGKTVRAAVDDLRFKQFQHGGDVGELVQDIITRGVVTPIEYRMLTGACEEGLREGMRSLGMDMEKVESVPISDVVRLSKGRYGGDRIAKLFADAAR